MNAEELAGMIDRYVLCRGKRLAADKAAAALKKIENGYKEDIIRECHATGIHMVGGATMKVTMRTKGKPMVHDWEAFNSYVIANNLTALYQKRLAEGAANEMIEDGIEIPGVEVYDVDTLSVSKI